MISSLIQTVATQTPVCVAGSVRIGLRTLRYWYGLTLSEKTSASYLKPSGGVSNVPVAAITYYPGGSNAPPA